MGQKARATLKEFFEGGKMPTEENFNDLIDSMPNSEDDRLIVKKEGDARYIGIGATNPLSPLAIRANGNDEDLISLETPEGKETWRISQKHNNKNGLHIGEAGEPDSQVFIQSGSGNVGIGIDDPQAKLHVDGDLKLQVGENVNQITNEISISNTPDNNYRANVLATEKAIQDYVDNLLVGSVSAFAMSTSHEGWLECDGREISRSNYARLFNKIGTSFGEGDDATTFNIPDLRGEFIRGWDNNRGVDNNRTFGISQTDQIQSHKHDDLGHSHSDAGHTHGYNDLYSPQSGVGYDSGGHRPINWLSDAGRTTGTGHANIQAGQANLSDPTTSTAGTPRHGQETRPRNVALMYCVKY